MSEIGRLLPTIAERLATTTLSPSLDASLLLAHVLAKPRSWILAHPEAMLDAGQERQLERLARRLQAGEPLPYIIGHWEFYGLDFLLTPAVLIPRPETELLVEQALAWLARHPGRERLLEVGTGSGCIAVSLALNCPRAMILASDISAPALSVARQNVARHGVADRVHLLNCDLIPAVARPFDLLCANLPYIPAETLPSLPVARHEPRLALDGGPGGLLSISRLLPRAPQVLAAGGLLLLEIDASHGRQVVSLAQECFPRAEVRLLPDLAGRDRLLAVQVP